MISETVCWHNKFGYCKFGVKCFRKHDNRICENVGCLILDCPLRHPKNCRYFLEFHYCKFGTFCKFNHKIEESSDAKKELDDLQTEIKRLEDKIKHMEIEIESKTKEIEKIKEDFENEMKEKNASNLKEYEWVQNEWHVTQMLFGSFKEDMAYKYGYDSNADSSEEEMEDDKDENTVCDICSFKAKSKGGLKTHITKKHRKQVE